MGQSHNIQLVRNGQIENRSTQVSASPVLPEQLRSAIYYFQADVTLTSTPRTQSKAVQPGQAQPMMRQNSIHIYKTISLVVRIGAMTFRINAPSQRCTASVQVHAIDVEAYQVNEMRYFHCFFGCVFLLDDQQISLPGGIESERKKSKEGRLSNSPGFAFLSFPGACFEILPLAVGARSYGCLQTGR